MWWNKDNKENKQVGKIFAPDESNLKGKDELNADKRKEEITQKLQKLAKNLLYNNFQTESKKASALALNLDRMPSSGNRLVLKIIDELIELKIKIFNDFANRKNKLAMVEMLADMENLINDRASSDAHYGNFKLVEIMIMETKLNQQLESIIVKDNQAYNIGKEYCDLYNDPNSTENKKNLYHKIEDQKANRARFAKEEEVVRKQLTALKEASLAFRIKNYSSVFVNESDFNARIEEALEEAAQNYYNAETVDQYIQSLYEMNHKPTQADTETPNSAYNENSQEAPLPAHMSMDN